MNYFLLLLILLSESWANSLLDSDSVAHFLCEYDYYGDTTTIYSIKILKIEIKKDFYCGWLADRYYLNVAIKNQRSKIYILSCGEPTDTVFFKQKSCYDVIFCNDYKKNSYQNVVKFAKKTKCKE